MSKMNRKNIGFSIAFLVLFAMCLTPTILLINQKPKVVYNETIIYETIIEEYYFNETIIINNTIYEYPNSTIELYSFDNIGYGITFFNETYNITKSSILMILINRNSDAVFPIMTIRINGTIMLWSTTKDFYMTVVLIGIYSIELKLNSDSPNYDVELLIGIFW